MSRWRAALAATTLVVGLGVAAASGPASAADPPPAAPSGLTATVVSGTVHLSWVDNSDDETSFDVYRSTYSPQYGWSQFGLVAVRNANDTTATETPPPGMHRYLVRSYSNVNGSRVGPNVVVKVRINVVMPAAPSNVTAAPSQTGVRLEWVDNSTDETHFQITRLTRAQGTTTWVADYGYMQFNHTSAPMPANDPSTTQVRYRLQSLNAYGLSAPAIAVVAPEGIPTFLDVTPMQCPNVSRCGTELNWSSADGGPGAYVIRYRSRPNTSLPWSNWVRVTLPVEGTGHQMSLPGPGRYQFSVAELSVDGITQSPWRSSTVRQIGPVQ